MDQRQRNAAGYAHLQRTFPDLDRWNQRSTITEEPEPRSDLARDAAATPNLGLTMNDLIRHSLVSATQHLNLARASIEARQFFPIGLSTALRGGLLGASRGVWVLHSSDPHVRRRRATRIARETQVRAREWVRETQNGLDPVSRATAEAVADEYIAEFDRRMKNWAADPGGDTSMVKEAAEIVFPEGRESGAICALWRQLSGDAHGLPWTLLTRASTTIEAVDPHPRYASPMIEMTSGNDLYEFADDFTTVYRILKFGWTLFDQRCAAP